MPMNMASQSFSFETLHIIVQGFSLSCQVCVNLLLNPYDLLQSVLINPLGGKWKERKSN